jgi:hypothetical protein
MKRNVRLLLVTCLVFGVAVILPFTSALAEETIQGVVTADGEIETADGELYLVDSNELGEELKALVGKKVEATGSVLEGMYGGYSITVTSYKQL